MTIYDLSFMEGARTNNWTYSKYIPKPLYPRKEEKFPMHSKKQWSGTKYCFVLSKEQFSYFWIPYTENLALSRKNLEKTQ